MSRATLPVSRRIRRSLDFDRIYEQRLRAGDEHLLVFAAANGLEHPRLGVSVSRKHGNAVRRARLKRLLREAFRLSQGELPRGLDLILIPRQNSSAGLDEYRRSLVRLASRLARRVGATGTGATGGSSASVSGGLNTNRTGGQAASGTPTDRTPAGGTPSTADPDLA